MSSLCLSLFWSFSLLFLCGPVIEVWSCPNPGPGRVGSPDGGGWFDDSVSLFTTIPKSPIRRIYVRSGKYVDAIQVMYATGASGAQHGENGGSLSFFDLNNGEYVTQIIGRSCSLVDQIQFITNLGRQSPAYGGTGGNPFVLSSPSPNHALAYITGRSGKYLDMFYPIWEVDPPISYVMQNVIYIPISLPTEIQTQSLAPFACVNAAPGRRACSATLTSTYTETTRWQFAMGLSTSASLVVKAGIPFFMKTVFEKHDVSTFFLGIDQTYSFTTGFSQPVLTSAGPYCMTESVLVISKVKIQVLFSCDALVTRRSGRITTEKTTGIYDGYPALDGFVLTSDETPLDPSKPPSQCKTALHATNLTLIPDTFSAGPVYATIA